MFTVEECRKHLQSWLDADFALATGKSYQIGTQNLTRANAAEVRERIEYWKKQLELAQIGGRRRKIYGVIPRDR